MKELNKELGKELGKVKTSTPRPPNFTERIKIDEYIKEIASTATKETIKQLQPVIIQGAKAKELHKELKVLKVELEQKKVELEQAKTLADAFKRLIEAFTGQGLDLTTSKGIEFALNAFKELLRAISKKEEPQPRIGALKDRDLPSAKRSNLARGQKPPSLSP